MSGIEDLSTLLRSMDPVRVPGEFVFVSSEVPLDVPTFATVREPEGLTSVVRRSDVAGAGSDHDFVAAWITLRVHSDLAAVGLTAAVSTALASAGISCNVLAGRFHDHLLVPVDRVDDAMAVLRDLAATSA